MPEYTVKVKKAYMKTTELTVVAENSDDAYDDVRDRIDQIDVGELERDTTFDEVEVDLLLTEEAE